MILDLIDAYRITKDFMNVLVFFFRYNHLIRLQLYFAFYLSIIFSVAKICPGSCQSYDGFYKKSHTQNV